MRVQSADRSRNAEVRMTRKNKRPGAMLRSFCVQQAPARMAWQIGVRISGRVLVARAGGEELCGSERHCYNSDVPQSTTYATMRPPPQQASWLGTPDKTYVATSECKWPGSSAG